MAYCCLCADRTCVSYFIFVTSIYVSDICDLCADKTCVSYFIFVTYIYVFDICDLCADRTCVSYFIFVTYIYVFDICDLCADKTCVSFQTLVIKEKDYRLRCGLGKNFIKYSLSNIICLCLLKIFFQLHFYNCP